MVSTLVYKTVRGAVCAAIREAAVEISELTLCLCGSALKAPLLAGLIILIAALKATLNFIAARLTHYEIKAGGSLLIAPILNATLEVVFIEVSAARLETADKALEKGNLFWDPLLIAAKVAALVLLRATGEALIELSTA